MTTGNHESNPSSSIVTDVESSPKMHGWIKLRETILHSYSPSNESTRTLLNSNRNKSLSKPQNSLANTNGHTLPSFETISNTSTINSPTNLVHSPSIISLPSTPRQVIDDTISLEIEPLSTSRIGREFEMESPSCTSTDSQQSPTIAKKITNRRSTRSKESPAPPNPPTRLIEISMPITEDISDDDVPLGDIHLYRTKPMNNLSSPAMNDSIIPLATNFQSLPGYTQEDLRDKRFLTYTDTDTLSNHLSNCLMIKKTSLVSSKPNIFKTRYNPLNKIFRMHFIKNIRRNLSSEKKSVFHNKEMANQPTSSVINSSTTATPFVMDWHVNRRNTSSTNRHAPKNIFHILQLNPRENLTFPMHSSSTSTTESPEQTLERIKDLLARTYYPRLYKAIEYRYQFGAMSKFPNAQQLIPVHEDVIPIKQRPESPCFVNDPVAITLKSPPATARQNFTHPQQSPMKFERIEKKRVSSSSSSIFIEDIQDISPLIIKKSIVLVTPTKIPLPSPPFIEKEKPLSNNRKRKSSISTTTNVVKKKKKRMISSLAPEIINEYEDITDSASDDEFLPSQLPKQTFIKNGLRSNYYKTSTTNGSKSTSKTRIERRRRQSSGSLPSFYTGIFESDDEKSPHIDYRLPYDIYYHSEQKTIDHSSSASIFPHQKKKSSRPKQKQPLPYKKISRNIYTDQIKQTLLASYSTKNAPVCDCQPPGTCEDGMCMNRLLFTECLPDCACDAKCSNQKIRKREWFKHLEAFETSKYGQGLRTTATIPKGIFLCEYVGEIITNEKFHERMNHLYSKDEHHYTMKLTQNLVIDAYRMGSIARFANHSCSPNCEFQRWTVDGLEHMCMFSSKTIKPGEELTYDYNFRCFNLQAQQPCYCDSSKCRGTIGTKQPAVSPTTTSNNHSSSQLLNMQKLTQREKRMVVESSIFLLRNLRQIKKKRELKMKNDDKEQVEKQPATALFFAQNYYHSSGLNQRATLTSLRKTPKVAHKEIFALFYNHIRRSHFVKSGRYQSELIDDQCYYAQLAQLTLILSEIFDLLIHYKCPHADIIPSVVLKKCPSKRLVPAYYQIISKPIDLTMIRNKLDHGEYSSFDLFEEDLALLFQNAVIFCSEDSDEARVVMQLKEYFLYTVKIEYQKKLKLFIHMKEENPIVASLHTLEEFVGRLHDREVIDGQIREILYNIIYCIDEHSNNNSPIVYKIVLGNNITSHRAGRARITPDYIVHCRCGSVYDENSLVQCYACQLWQHVACVSIADPSRPYHCFECQPTCEQNPLACLKSHVLITATLSPLQTYDDNHTSYSTLTRSDGFIIRINECYFVPKQEEGNIDRSLTSPEYDILCVERLWIDDYGIGQASGFYYIRPNETFHEPTRKFFPNEVFRFPASNDPLPISSFVRPCFVLDMKTYLKGKPISDNSSRVLSSDLFICEYRVDKTARTFTRLAKSRQFGINTKSYCFSNYVDKPVIKRDYQPYQKEVQQYQQDNRRRLAGHVTRSNNKQLKEKNTRINGLIEKIYCRFHDQHLIPTDTKYNINQLLQPSSQSLVSIGEKSSSSPSTHPRNISNKRHTISLSSDDDIVEFIPENEHRKKRLIKPTNLNSHKRDELID